MLDISMVAVYSAAVQLSKKYCFHHTSSSLCLCSTLLVNISQNSIRAHINVVLKKCIYFCIKGIYGYHGNRKLPFLKITMALPRLIAAAKRLLESGFVCPGYSQYGFQAYESNIDFEIRYWKLLKNYVLHFKLGNNLINIIVIKITLCIIYYFLAQIPLLPTVCVYLKNIYIGGGVRGI